MKKVLLYSLIIGILSTCTTTPLQTEPPTQATLQVPTAAESVGAAPEPTGQAAAADDFFSQQGISLPAPVCSGLTPTQTEGPYYTPDTPERNSLLEAGMAGTRLVLAGYVLDQNCQPLPNAWLDFWQADSAGNYDNSGYTLRGHQYTDPQGRYHLETVVPGEYPGRTEHIHVKVQAEGGAEVTSQLYFPDVPANQRDGIFDPALILTLEDRGDHLVGYFNFVIQK